MNNILKQASTEKYIIVILIDISGVMPDGNFKVPAQKTAIDIIAIKLINVKIKSKLILL